MVQSAGSQPNGPKYDPSSPMVVVLHCSSACVGRPRSCRAVFCSSTAGPNRLSPARRTQLREHPGTSGPNQLCGLSRRPIDRRNASPLRPAMTLQRLLVGLVDLCRRNALRVVLVSGLLAMFAGWYAAGHLGINTDTDEMFAASLPWRQRAELFKSYFPQFRDLLVAVIDAKEPEEADATAAALAER